MLMAPPQDLWNEPDNANQGSYGIGGPGIYTELNPDFKAAAVAAALPQARPALPLRGVPAPPPPAPSTAPARVVH